MGGQRPAVPLGPAPHGLGRPCAATLPAEEKPVLVTQPGQPGGQECSWARPLAPSLHCDIVAMGPGPTGGLRGGPGMQDHRKQGAPLCGWSPCRPPAAWSHHPGCVTTPQNGCQLRAGTFRADLQNQGSKGDTPLQ